MSSAASEAIVVPPSVNVDPRLEDNNVFHSIFGHLDADGWLDVLSRSITENVIDGVEMPGFPPPSFQSQLHGHFGRHSLSEAASFYRFVQALGLTGPSAPWYGKGYLLDFGAGWGRICRLFLRDFPLRHIIGYEPSNRFCSVARRCNPFVSFLSGAYLPDYVLPASQFNLVISWSVFSHLSPVAASAWLAEIERVTAPGAAVVCTTWGKRFLQRLVAEKALKDSGEEIHWYSAVCLEAIGDIGGRIEAYDKGDFIWFTNGASSLYGESFISTRALETLLRENAPKLELEIFDTTSLAQDVFVLRRRG
jgi:hypothetical protein